MPLTLRDFEAGTHPDAAHGPTRWLSTERDHLNCLIQVQLEELQTCLVSYEEPPVLRDYYCMHGAKQPNCSIIACHMLP